MSSALRQAFRRVAPPAQRMGVRRFGGSHGGHGAEEVEKWKKVSMGATVVVILYSLKEFAGILGGAHDHHDHGDKPLPDYMQIRSKPFPWECSNCSMFDTHCFEKCKAERAGQAVEH